MIYSLDVATVEILFAIHETKSILKIGYQGRLISSCQVSPGYRMEQVEIPVSNGHCEFIIEGKTEQDTEVENGAVVRDACVTIDKLWINGILINESMSRNFIKFWPHYNQSNIQYAEQNGFTLPEVMTNEQSFFYNGRVQIELQDFFVRYHAMLHQGLQHHNHWALISNLGHVEHEAKQELLDILKTL